MPALGEYLGSLLAEVTSARLLADLETARIAQLYASHPLLQHMPVPRFRLPTVTLDLPVAVEGTDQPTTTPPAAALQAVRQKLDAIVSGELTQHKVQLTPASAQRLSQELSGLFERLAASKSLSALDAANASGEAVTAVLEAIKSSSAERTAVDPTIESSLRQQLGAEFVKLQPTPPRVQLLVITAQLKEIAPPATLTQIHLTISEEGVEWTQTNPEDSSSKTLLPE